MGRVAAYVRAFRPLAQANIALPLALGEAYAFHSGSRSLVTVAAIHAWGVAAHAAIILQNDYDDRDTDDGVTTWVSGGSGVLQSGGLSPHELHTAARAASAALVILSMAYGWVLSRPLLALAGPAALLVNQAYGSPPIHGSRSPLGAVLQTGGMGLGLPGFAWYALTGDPRAPAVLLALGVTYAFASHIATAYPDEASDRACGKRTFVVTLGASASLRVGAALMLGLSAVVAREADAFRSVAYVAPLSFMIAAVVAGLVPVRSDARARGVHALVWLGAMGFGLAMHAVRIALG